MFKTFAAALVAITASSTNISTHDEHLAQFDAPLQDFAETFA
jgi:hypothetical protein